MDRIKESLQNLKKHKDDLIIKFGELHITREAEVAANKKLKEQKAEHSKVLNQYKEED